MLNRSWNDKNMNLVLNTWFMTFNHKVHYTEHPASMCVHTTCCFCYHTYQAHHLSEHKCGRWAHWEGTVIRRRLAHTAADSCNQQKKEEGDSRGQLVSSDKAFCITSDWVGILRRCAVMIGISCVLPEDPRHFLSACVRKSEGVKRESENVWVFV